MRIEFASTSSYLGVSSGEDLPIYWRRDSPITRQYGKVRCRYCGQKQDALNDDCQFCGAPLPDEEIYD